MYGKNSECVGCLFFNMIDDLRQTDMGGYGGECRRSPRTMVPDSEDIELPYEWKYPFVIEGDWCGEFQPIANI